MQMHDGQKIQLFILPFAGGSIFSFLKFCRLLNQNIVPVPIEYSGHGSRRNERLIDKYDDFLQDVLKQIEDKRDTSMPYAIFGYSLGSVLAFDLCKDDMIAGRRIHSFYCAEGGLISENPIRKYSDLSEKEFEENIARLGGMDERLVKLQDQYERQLILLRNDFDVLSQYRYVGKKANGPATIIYSDKDETCRNMSDWEESINGISGVFSIGDDHFFINKYYREVANIVNQTLLFD